MAKVRVVLHFSSDKVNSPLAYHLVKDYDLKINILRAKIDPNEEGKLLIEIENHTSERIKAGLDYLRSEGVSVELVDHEISFDCEECISCGACTAVCRSRAVAMDQNSGELIFDRDRCTVCGACVKVCPVGVITIGF